MNSDSLLKRLEIYVGLFKFYFELAIKICLFYFGVVGAIFSYYFVNANGNELVRYSLLIPIIFSLLFSVIFFWGAYTLAPIQQEIKLVSDKLESYSVISIHSLKIFLIGSGLAFCVVLLGALLLLLKP